MANLNSENGSRENRSVVLNFDGTVTESDAIGRVLHIERHEDQGNVWLVAEVELADWGAKLPERPRYGIAQALRQTLAAVAMIERHPLRRPARRRPGRIAGRLDALEAELQRAAGATIQTS
jgi:hypothetical protein